MKINIQGFNSKTNKFNKDFDLNTTSEIGFVQPILCEPTIPQGSYHIKRNMMCQCAPLLSPLWGRLSVRTYSSFIKMSDIFHHFDEVLTHRKMTHGNQSTLCSAVPTVKYRNLIRCMLEMGCVCTIWSRPFEATPSFYPFNEFGVGVFSSEFFDSIIKHIVNPSSIDGQPTLPDTESQGLIMYHNFGQKDSEGNWHFDGFTPGYTSVMDANKHFYNTYGAMPTIENSDLMYQVTLGTGSSITQHVICIRLSQRARNFRKVLLGLGLQIDMNVFDDDYEFAGKDINILPFVAYYKAWFDIMYPTKNIAFSQTNCGKLISLWDSTSMGITTYEKLYPLMYDIANMTYVFDNDYYTSHIYPAQNFDDSATLSTGVSGEGIVSGGSSLPTLNNDSVQFTSAGLRLLNSLNNMFLSGTIIGKKFEDYLKQYGVNIPDTSFLGSSLLNIDTGIVMSNNENENVFVGQKFGHAEGRGSQDGFNFKAKDHGYLISFMCVVPISGFSQGIDPKFFRYTRYDFYNQQFDGLGYRLTPFHEFFGSYNVGTTFRQGRMTRSAIGYTGRYNDYKYSRNISNGDFSRRPTKTAIGSFYLDKRMPEYDIIKSVINEDTGREDVRIITPNIPYPSLATSRLCNNEYYDYNRIFLNRDEYDGEIFVKRFYDPMDDHFVIDMVNDFKAFLPALPISQSLGTDISNDDYSVEKSIKQS